MKITLALSSLIVSAAIAACAESPSAPQADETSQLSAASAVVNSLTGSGAFDSPGFTGPFKVRMSITAQLLRDGTARGLAVHRADLTQFGLQATTFSMSIDCLVVSGDTAWFSGIGQHSSSGYPPPGAPGIGWVIDKPDGDLVFSGPPEFWAPGATCADKPPLPPLPAYEGGFTVR
jgi:hypothetical protein